MRIRFVSALVITLVATLWVSGLGEQTILTAYAPAGSDGTSILLSIDWGQVHQAAPTVTNVLLRRRPAGPPVISDTLAVIPADSARYLDTGLDASTAYHYYAYFKDAQGETARFGSVPAVVHLGPVHTLPQK
jgi:hypothetical protein